LALLLALPWQSMCDFGGHDLFTSLAQLEVLWHNDRQIVKDMEALLGKNDNLTQTMKRYVTACLSYSGSKARLQWYSWLF
jgi:hypothetical protein